MFQIYARAVIDSFFRFRQTYSVLVVQIARVEHQLQLRNLRQLYVQGSQGISASFLRMAPRAWHEMFGNSEHGPFRQRHPDRGCHGLVGETQATKEGGSLEAGGGRGV